jgi:hypothetical protein
MKNPKHILYLVILIVGAVYFGRLKYSKYKFNKELQEYRELSKELDPSYSTTKRINNLSDDEIKYAAHQYVLPQLKAPSTAKFPSLNSAKISKNDDGTYIVSSYVDSQNEFGAMVRTNWAVKLKNLPDGNVQMLDIIHWD